MELSYDQLVAVVRAEGVDLREVNITSGGKNYNSRDMCRCHSGDVNQTYHVVGGNHVRGWAPDGDMTVHITAGDLGTRTPEQYILDILLTNPNAPLAANFAVMPDGTAYILSAGRTNHDLYCSPAAKAAYDNETWSLDNYQDLRGTGVDPKVFTYGIENVSSTSLDTKPLARATSVKICAAICRAYGRSGRNVAGHGECASDRSYSDPGINMGLFRRDVMAHVQNKNVQEDDVTPQELHDELVKFAYGPDLKASLHSALVEAIYGPDLKAVVDGSDDAVLAKLDTLADAIVSKLPTGTELTKDDVKSALQEVIASSVQVSGELSVTPTSTPSA